MMLYAESSMHAHCSFIARDVQGGSALHAACCRLEERCCDDDSFPEIVKMLVAHGADVNAHVSDVSQQVRNE